MKQTKTENPKVSVVITAYNVAEYIKEAVQSALNQTLQEIEVIVVEDCSNDKTLEILQNFKDPKLKIIQNPQNMGAGMGRKIGIENAKGEYVLLLDGDDWLEDDFIETLYNKAFETGADIVSGGIKLIRENGAYDITSYGNCETTGTEKVTKFWGERIVFMNNKLIHKKLHELVPYCTRRYIEDTPTIIPQLHLSNKVVYVDNVGYNYRMRAGSLTHESSHFKNALYRVLCWFDLIDFFNVNGPEIYQKLDFKENMQKELKILQSFDITDEMILPFLTDWLEYSKRVLKYL